MIAISASREFQVLFIQTEAVNLLQLARKWPFLTGIQLPERPRHKAQIWNSHLLAPNGEMVQWKSLSKNSKNYLKSSSIKNAAMSCAIKRVANALNNRPLSVQKSANPYPDADLLSPITPSMLLTWHSSSTTPLERDVHYDKLPLTFVEELELAWWYQYKVQYFASLIPTQKWIDTSRKLSVDDVVLIEYKSKLLARTAWVA